MPEQQNGTETKVWAMVGKWLAGIVAGLLFTAGGIILGQVDGKIETVKTDHQRQIDLKANKETVEQEATFFMRTLNRIEQKLDQLPAVRRSGIPSAPGVHLRNDTAAAPRPRGTGGSLLALNDWARYGVPFLIGLLVAALLAISSAAKAFMDVSKFIPYEYAFPGFPERFRKWMDKEGTFPVLKIDDGWHVFQAAMFLTFGVAFFLAAATFYPLLGWWAFPAAWAIRLAAQRFVFETLYKALNNLPPKGTVTA